VKREIIRVEPLSTYLANWKAPTSAVTRCGDTIYVSGFPPFDPDTGKVIEAPIERLHDRSPSRERGHRDRRLRRSRACQRRAQKWVVRNSTYSQRNPTAA
jgi:hypothetical protein